MAPMRPYYEPPPRGQHFLNDRGLLDEIVTAAEVGAGDRVVEVGVGTGNLTRAILATGASVTGVELDAALASKVETQFAGEGRFRLVRGDIMRVRWEDLFPAGERGILMGNLPYSVSTQVVFRALEMRDRVRRAVFLVQWEVGHRMAAPPGGKDYGILSVACQLFSRVEVLRKVLPGAFLPPPRVDSALVRMNFSIEPLFTVANETFTLKVVKASFGQRRKKLVNSLSACLQGVDRGTIAPIIARMGLRDDVRAERLTVEQFAELANALAGVIAG